MFKKFRFISLIVVVMVSVLLTSCGNSSDHNSSKKGDQQTDTKLGKKDLTMPYVSWASAVAGVNVMKAVLEEVGYNVDLKQVEAGAVFSSLAGGSSDISVGTVTLPNTHADYWKKYKDQVDDASVSMKKSVTIGLAVPTYMKVNSIEDLKKDKNHIGEKTHQTITGIDPGAGQMQITKDPVMKKYGLDKWKLQASSAPAMTAALKKAIDAHDPIVVTLWKPHWAFLAWDLKFLKDPKGLFGKPDSLHAVTRKGLKKDSPAAYKVMSQFHWKSKDMGKVMMMIHKGMDPSKAAKKWVKNHPDQVEKWTKGVK